MQFIKSLITVLAVFLITFPNTNCAAQDLAYQDELISKSQSLKLHEDPQWIALLHYKTDIFGNNISLAESGSIFFNASDGNKNPESELIETLKVFFKKEERIEGTDSESYQCAFKARYNWLKQRLAFDSSKLKQAECKLFDEWYAAINPASLTLVFPSSYLNNPASAFGHTLLRMDQANQTEKTRLLAYTANYAAATTGENPISFAIKGIFGGYPGYFSVAPYYEKVKKYSDLEKRDIWEYSLNFTPAEIKLMVEHMWELRTVPFSYFYFDENCSYHLLFLLDVARPSLGLLKSNGTWVLPVDTVRELASRPEIVKEAVFRPSWLTKINYHLSQMPKEKQKLTKAIIKNSNVKENPNYLALDGKSKAEVVDLAYEYLNYRIVSGKSEYQKQAFGLLRERSLLPQGGESIVPTPEYRPEQSHPTARLGIGLGREDGRWQYDIRYRAVYHDLMDPQQGFYGGAQIEMLDTAFRQRENGNFRLNKLDIVDILSLTPRNELFKPISWDFKFGFEEETLKDNSEHLLFKVEGGGGQSWNFSDSAIGYALVDLSSKFSDELEEDYSIGVKPKLGLYLDPSEKWRINLNASYANYFFGDNHNASAYGMEQRFTLDKNKALRIIYKHDRAFDNRDNEYILAFDYYL